jgi:hypothetical protein
MCTVVQSQSKFSIYFETSTEKLTLSAFNHDFLCKMKVLHFVWHFVCQTWNTQSAIRGENMFKIGKITHPKFIYKSNVILMFQSIISHRFFSIVFLTLDNKGRPDTPRIYCTIQYFLAFCMLLRWWAQWKRSLFVRGPYGAKNARKIHVLLSLLQFYSGPGIEGEFDFTTGKRRVACTTAFKGTIRKFLKKCWRLIV